jgi:hypothetical protein
MKIFKLKYLAVVLVAGLLGSCTATDNLPEAAVNAAIENGDFVMDPNMHYFVDGLSTNDKDLIESKMKDAWNVHFDDSKNKVVISTTPARFEKYKDSNIEFKNALAENDKAALNSSNEEKGSDTASRTMPANAIDEINTTTMPNQNLIAITYTTAASNVVILYYISASFDSNTYTTSAHVTYYSKTTGSLVYNEDNVDDFHLTSLLTDPYVLSFRARLMNDNPKITVTKTFYKNISYGGSSLSFTAKINNSVDLAGIKEFDAKSFK